MTTSLSWEDLAAQVATIGRLPEEQVRPDTRLVEDLGYDSLALAELVVLLVDAGQIALTASELEGRDWSGVTVGQLHAECGTVAAGTGGGA